jgi:hypothetical protein
MSDHWWALSAMIAPGPIVGGGWDAIVRDCERALEKVKPGTTWMRRKDLPQLELDALVPVRHGLVLAVERTTMWMAGPVGTRPELPLVHVRIRWDKKRYVEIRGDRFLRECVQVEPKT